METEMTKGHKSDTATGTVVDRRLAPHRLKEGLVPADTGIYLRVEEGPGQHDVYILSAGGV